jgi:hypothetical protein
MPSQVSTVTGMHDQGVRRVWLLSSAHRGGRPPKHGIPLEQIVGRLLLVCFFV